MDGLLEVLAGAILVLGVMVATIAVLGVLTLPDVLTRLHAAGKAVFLGVAAIVMAAALAGDGDLVGRAVLIVLFLALSTPASSHAIAWAAARGSSRDDPPRHETKREA